jgi:hypothetical protein
VLSLAEGERRLGVAAADAGPLALPLDGPSLLGLARLERAAARPGEGPLAAVFRAAEALSGRAVDQRFFAAFRRTLDLGRQALPARVPATDRHALALLQLTRILFLYFVEAKGWLAGRPRFLREEVDRCLAARHSLHRHLLAPLFFGTLNRTAASRSAMARRFGPIPFLNGGLFEPHPLERRWRVHLPTPVLQQAFDDLFERFHFTLDRSAEAAIAPDMLGHVFEGVMEPAERRTTGSFYTPAPLVDALVTETLAAWLGAREGIGDAAAERRLRDPDRAIRAALRTVRVLDPAAGSGAFLLGALRQLAGPGAGIQHAARLRRVLARNLFGVDRNAAAVRLAELRLWLEVIGADPSGRPARVRPLPNLDAMLRQGDSLLEPRLARPPSGPDAAGLGRIRRELISASGPDKRRLLGELRRTELAIARVSIDADLATLEAEIAGLLRLGRGATLFGERRGLGREEARALAALRHRRREARAAARHLARSDEVPWFRYATHFAEVLARGGFDVVIGNPPWVRAEAIERPVRRYLAERFRWFRPARSGPNAYAHLPDLSIAFLERGLELLAPGGVVGLLLPAKVATSGYAAVAREALTRHATLHLAADLGTDPRARFDATVYPFALVATRRPPMPKHRVRLGPGPDAASIPQRELGAGPWPLGRSGAASIAERLRAAHPSLGDRFTCHLGVKTGLNRAFLDPPDSVEPELIRWAIRGRDVRASGIARRHRLLWPCDDRGRPLPELPVGAARHLRPFLAELARRADHHTGPPWTLFRTAPASAPHRVVWSDLSRFLQAVALTGPGARKQIPLNSCYLVATATAAEAHALAAWLNTSWCRILAAHGADPASGGFHRFNARCVAALPFPSGGLGAAWLDAASPDAAGNPLSPEALDDRAADLLDLDANERLALADLAGEVAAPRR